MFESFLMIKDSVKYFTVNKANVALLWTTLYETYVNNAEVHLHHKNKWKWILFPLNM